MGRPNIYAGVVEEDMALSGPHVWPRMTADRAVDRFIHRRPELAYLTAKRRIAEDRKKNENQERQALMRVRVSRVFWSESRKHKSSYQKFGHIIDYEDPEEDVRKFLEKLRFHLKQYMPDSPMLNCSVQIRLYDEGQNEATLSWQERWL